MKLFFIIAIICLLLVFGIATVYNSSAITPTPSPTTDQIIIPTDTPIPTNTPIPQQATYFTTPLYCPQIYLQGVTPCTDANKTPVACVAQFHPDGSPVINLICGIPGNSNSVKGCVSYANNPNIVVCP